MVLGAVGGSSGTDAQRRLPRKQASGMAHQLLLRLPTWGDLAPNLKPTLRTTCTRRNSNVTDTKVVATSCVEERRLGQKS